MSDAAIAAAICRQQKSFVACDSPSNVYVAKRLEGLAGKSWGDDFEPHASALASDMPLFHPHYDYDASLVLEPQSPWQ